MQRMAEDQDDLHQTFVDLLRSSQSGDADLLKLLADHPEFTARLRGLLKAHDMSVATLDLRPSKSATGSTNDDKSTRVLDVTLADQRSLTPDPSSSDPHPTRVDDPTLAEFTPSVTTTDVGALKRFGDYQLHDEIARGGMGVIFRAHQVSLDRPVALKMILSGQLAGEAEIARFRSEAESAAQLNHRGIVPIYEVGELDGQHFFAMGLVNGSSLAERISESPLDGTAAATMVKQIAEAVGYAHQQGVVHRDLKPANVLIDEDGTPLVTDFGIAKRVNKDSQLTNDGQVLGTPSYMPPEQASGKIELVGPRSDVYSLGAILYATITGKPPFQGSTPLETVMMVLERDPTHPSHWNPDVDQDLETICLKCMQKDPELRYASADDFIADLNRYLRGEPLAARPISPAAVLWRWHRRLRHHKTVRVRSTTGIGTLPWVDIATGPDQESGQTRGVARGVIAIGDRAHGVIALGDSARGFVAIGGTCVGVLAVGTRAIGAVAFGALGIGVISFSAVSLGFVAFGGVAVGRVAVGGVAFGVYTFGALALGAEGIGIGRSDPKAQEYFSIWIRRLFGSSGG